MPLENLTTLQIYSLATELHLGQYRSSGLPYITHPVAVANLSVKIVDRFFTPRLFDDKSIERLKQVALLHDVLEDCDIDEPGLITQGVDPIVARDCQRLNKHNFSNYTEYILSICTQPDNTLVQIVKYADLLHNSYKQINVLKSDRYSLAMALLDLYVPEFKHATKELKELTKEIH
jgi:(p)ppGpp synthase/HD superfamily hydrolase